MSLVAYYIVAEIFYRGCHKRVINPVGTLAIPTDNAECSYSILFLSVYLVLEVTLRKGQICLSLYVALTEV